MSDLMLQIVVWGRLVERGFLTLFVLIACGLLMRQYAGTMTDIKADLKAAAGRLPASSISLTIGTPILVVLLFVGYAYVDLSNRIEFSEPGSGTPFAFRGLNKAAEQDSGSNNTVDRLSGPQAVADRARLDFSFWVEKNFELVFVSLSNKAQTPLTPQIANKIIQMTFIVGCLDTESTHESRDFDEFSAGKSFAQLDDALEHDIKSMSFKNGFCEALKARL